MSSQLSIAVNNSIILFLLIMCMHVLISKSIQQRPGSGSEAFRDGGEAPSSIEYTLSPPPVDASGSGADATQNGPSGFAMRDASQAGAPLPAMGAAADQDCNAPVISECAKVAIDGMKTMKNDEEDLYQYVFGESISKRREGPKTTGSQKQEDPPSPSPSRPTTNTCSAASKVYPTSGAARDTSGHMIIGRYNNEKGLNGGEVYNGLMAYDGSDSAFEELV
jgi:hypothetical protein